MPAEQYLKRRERLLISAIRLLDESGLSGVTTREMAKREGISEPAVYRHFNGKAEVLLAILDQFAAFDTTMENTVRENSMRPLDAIRHVCLAYAGYYSGYPEIATVMFSLDLWKYDPQVEIRMKEIFANRHRLMRELVEECIREHSLPQNTNKLSMADLLANLIISATRQWRLEDMCYPLTDRVENMLDIVLQNCSAGEDPQK